MAAKPSRIVIEPTDLQWTQDALAAHGDHACPDLMPRTTTQRRYDAFQNLLAHVHVPTNTNTNGHGNGDANGDGDGDGGGGGGGQPTATDTIVNIVADVDTYLAALDRLFGDRAGGDSAGGDGRRRPFPLPFGPTAGRCQTIDGHAVSPRDMILASLAGHIRVVLTGIGGKVIAMTSRQRFFRGALRDAVLLQATRCTHPGCMVTASHCTIDHETPSSHHGPTSTDNGSGTCDHHNHWRYTARATIRRHTNGRITTHRTDGTDIAPPD